MRKSADLEFGLTGGSLWQPHCPQDQPASQEGFVIDPRLGAASLRALAASKEDSRPHAILKFQHRNSIDYRVRYEPQLNYLLRSTIFFRLRALYSDYLLRATIYHESTILCFKKDLQLYDRSKIFKNLKLIEQTWLLLLLNLQAITFSFFLPCLQTHDELQCAKEFTFNNLLRWY